MSADLAMHEIHSREEFEGLKLARTGVIVNLDTPTRKATAHRPWCERLRGVDFETKVIENEGRTAATTTSFAQTTPSRLSVRTPARSARRGIAL